MKYTNKKAISPLIATVLVIGFTIVLAGVVMQFLIPLFTSSTQKSTADANLLSICGEFTTTVSVKDTKSESGKLTFTVDNAGSGTIQNLVVKVYSEQGAKSCKVVPNTATTPPETEVLASGSIKTIELPTDVTGCMLPEGKIYKVEVTPEVHNTATNSDKICSGVVLSASVY